MSPRTMSPKGHGVSPQMSPLTECGSETEVHWRQTFAKATDCTALRAICVRANEQNLDRLVAAVAKLV